MGGEPIINYEDGVLELDCSNSNGLCSPLDENFKKNIVLTNLNY